MTPKKNEEEKLEGKVDVLGIQMKAGTDLSKILESANNVGQLLGNISTILNNKDRIKSSGSDNAKLLGTFGLTLGAIIDGAREASEYHTERLMLPSEHNERMRGEIAELEAVKESLKLKEKIETLMKEVSKLPVSDALPKTQKEISEEIEKKEKEIESLKKNVKPAKSKRQKGK